MALALHKDLAAKINRVRELTHGRGGIETRLDRVRCDLDIWVQCEYDRTELPSEDFFEMYYPGTPTGKPRRFLESSQRNEVDGHLEHIARSLRESYPDCAALRRLLHNVALAKKSLADWSPAR